MPGVTGPNLHACRTRVDCCEPVQSCSGDILAGSGAGVSLRSLRRAACVPSRGPGATKRPARKHNVRNREWHDKRHKRKGQLNSLLAFVARLRGAGVPRDAVGRHEPVHGD
jgi:hypothetical protein